MLRLLTGADVRRLLPMPAAIDQMRTAFAALSAGAAEVPVRSRLDAGATGCSTLLMPAYLPAAARVGLKVVTIQAANAARGLPTTQGVMLVLDAETGRAEALMDAEALTAIRTGAASGLATDLLARPDARTVAVIGAGAQAETQLEAVCAVRDIEQAYVFSRTPARAEAFATQMTERLGRPVVVAEAPDQLRLADVVCTATTSIIPVFDPAHLAPGVHINGVGSYRPDMAEVPAEVIRAATVVVDHRASCLAEAGDLLQPFDTLAAAAAHLHAELGELVLGLRAGRQRADEVTVFKSVGNAVQDVAAAGYVVQQAVAEGIGQLVRL